MQEIILPVEKDYPEDMFRPDLPPALRVGCARAYFKVNLLARRLFRRRVEVAFALTPKRSWKCALDAGTGAGFLLPWLSSIARQAVGIDLSPVLGYTQAMLAKRGIGNVGLQTADLLHLPFHQSAFDLVVCLSVIEHIPNPNTAFSEMGRVLREGGVLIIGYPLEHALLELLEWLLRLESRLVRLRTSSRSEWFHPHVSHYRRIERSLHGAFRVDGQHDIALLGIPLYRTLRLVKTV